MNSAWTVSWVIACSSTEMRTRVESARVGQLLPQRALAIVHVTRHGDLDDRIKIALGPIRAREAPAGQAQLLSSARSGGHLQGDPPRGRRDLDARAEHRFPRRQRHI